MKSYKDILEALKGNQHKIDKNKNGKVDAHDFKLLRKEEEQIVFKNGEDDDEEKKKEEMKEAAPPGFEGTVKAMKKKKEIDNPYALAWSMYKKGYKSHKNSDGTMKEESEQIDEKSEQAKQNKTMKNMMDASRGARYKLNNPVPDAAPEHKTARAHNVAIGRALRNEEEKPPFDGPYTKTKPAKNSDGTPQAPMSRARALAKDAMKKQMKEDIDRLFEAKDDSEYNYEGEMAVTQLKTISRHAEALQAKMQPDTNLPEWVQSKITLATDYLQTAHDYLMSELDEQAPVAPVPDRKYIKGTPENKAYKATKKPINGHPTNKVNEEEADNLSYKDFMEAMTATQVRPGVTRYTGGSYGSAKGAKYGNTDYDKETLDTKDDESNDQQKRGRGRPAGAKSGARGPRIK